MREIVRRHRVASLLSAAVLPIASVLFVAPAVQAAGGVTMFASQTAGLWDQAQVNISVNGMPPGTVVGFSMNVASDPTNLFQFLPYSQPANNFGSAFATIQVPQVIGTSSGTFDCASAPEACDLVAYDTNNPFGNNAFVPLSFGRIDLLRTVPDQGGPNGLGPGDPITGSDTVAPGEWIWASGTGFQPNMPYQLNECRDVVSQVCRNTMESSPQAFTDASTDGQYGSFGVPLQVGRNVFGPWGVTPGMTVNPMWAIRDGQTLAVNATNMPPASWLSDCGAPNVNGCWIGAAQPWIDTTAHIKSSMLSFSGGPVPVSATLSEVLWQQLMGLVHIESAVGMQQAITWDQGMGLFSTGYTVARWVQSPGLYGPYSPASGPENGYYDCADAPPWNPTDPGQPQGPVQCSMLLQVSEDNPGGQLIDFYAFPSQTLQFAPFDLTAATTSAVLGTKPAGVTLKGNVTCTGYSPEQYLVNVQATVSQTTGGRRATTVTGSSSTTVLCSGTMTNPGTALWSVFVPGAFQGGSATASLDVSSAGFTMSAYPLHVSSSVTITVPKTRGK